MKSIIDFQKIGETLTYDYYIEELRYIQKALRYIEENIESDSIKFEDTFSQSNMDQYSKNKIEEEHKSLQLTIIEGLFIRQIALVEKFFVKLSITIYKEKTKYRDVIFPPWIDASRYQEKKFTDSEQAVKYLKQNFNIKIANISEWNTYMQMRKIRHALAHGHKRISFDEKEKITNFNTPSIGQIIEPLSEKSNVAYLSINIKPHIKLSETLIKLINSTKKITY